MSQENHYDSSILKDEDVQLLLRSSDFPDIYLIAEIAKKHNITEVRQFWEFFDKVRQSWIDRKTG